MNKPIDKKIKIAYLGPEGSYREAAVRSFDGEAIYLACESTEDALNNLMNGDVALAMLPVDEKLNQLIANGGKYKQLNIIKEIDHKVVYELFEYPYAMKVNKVVAEEETIKHCADFIRIRNILPF